MAVNEILQPRYNLLGNTLLRTLESAPYPIVGPELIATLALEVDRPEWHFLSKSALCAAEDIIGLLALNFSAFQITNISTINQPLLMVITSVLALVTTAANIQTQWGAFGATPAAVKGTTVDTRAGITKRAVGEVKAFNSPGPATGQTISRRLAGVASTQELLSGPLILGPAQAVQFWTDTPTLASFSARWYERALLPSEL